MRIQSNRIAVRAGLGLQGLLDRFRRNSKGAAAIEFALVAPLLVGAFLLMGDFATALNAQDATARKARRAIEGVLRYGNDKDKVVAFANANGAAAFTNAPTPATSNVTLLVEKFYVCPDAVIPIMVPLLESVTCPNPETWYKITTASSTVGMFGKTYNVSTKVDILVDKK